MGVLLSSNQLNLSTIDHIIRAMAGLAGLENIGVRDWDPPVRLCYMLEIVSNVKCWDGRVKYMRIFKLPMISVRAGSIREHRNFNQSAKPAHSPRPNRARRSCRRERGLLYRRERGHDAGSAASSTCPVPFPGIWCEFAERVKPFPYR